VFGDRDEMLAIAKERLIYLQNKGYGDAAIYGENEMDGLHVITVMKYKREAYGLPENPQASWLLGLLPWMKPLAGLGFGAVIAGLAISFITGIGYRRHKMHYDEVAHDVIDDETGEVIRHVDAEGEEQS
jgi:formate dehydrogenase iron-sulfur subunit